jgi:alpha-glucosidase
MEQSKGGMRDNPDNHVNLAFTRMAVGPADYTPGGFNNVTREQFVPRAERPMVMGTRAHHLAMYVVDFAPFQMVSDDPQAYEDEPAFDFIRQVPTTWDETRVLGGTPDTYVAIARRSGSDWFIGAMTNWTPRDVKLPMNFLGDGKFTARLFIDNGQTASDPKALTISERPILSTDSLTLHLSSGGGAAIILRAKR